MYLCVYTCCLSLSLCLCRTRTFSLSLSFSLFLALSLFVCIDGAAAAEKCQLNCRTAAALNWKYSTNRSNVQFAQTQTPASTDSHPHTHIHSAHMHPSTPCSKYSSAMAAILNLIVGKDEKLRRFTKVLFEFHRLHLQSATPTSLYPPLYPFSVPPLSFYVLLTVVFALLNNAL